MLPNKSQTGFSLLEILIAVAILASSFLALLSAQGGAFLASGRSEDLTRATLLAREKIAEVEMQLDEEISRGKFPEDDSEETGEFDRPFDDYRWKVSIRKVEIPVADVGSEDDNALVAAYVKNVMDQISKAVREVKVTIYWGDKNRPEEEQTQFSVTTHRVKM